jgi:ABC-type sugar transport system permease subunit
MSEPSSPLDNEVPLQSLHIKDHAKYNRIRRLKDGLEGYLFLLPWLIGVFVFVAYPILDSLYMSFTKVSVALDGSGLEYKFLGWKNYSYAFITDNEFPVKMFLFVLFLAAFQTIPVSVYEAARIDGVTPWESFWKITFPAIVPFIFLNMIYTVVDQTTSPFNPILTLISKNMGDPLTGFGYSSALGWMYCVVIFIPIVLLAAVAKLVEKGRR